MTIDIPDGIRKWWDPLLIEAVMVTGFYRNIRQKRDDYRKGLHAHLKALMPEAQHFLSDGLKEWMQLSENRLAVERTVVPFPADYRFPKRLKTLPGERWNLDWYSMMISLTHSQTGLFRGI